MLAGYSAAIVGFPSVDAPEAIFDTAVARVQEITLGPKDWSRILERIRAGMIWYWRICSLGYAIS